MDFVKAAEEYLPKIGLTLQPNSIAIKRMLKLLKPTETLMHVCCTKWGCKEWVGKIYRKGTKEKAFFEAYGRQFNGIEFMANFYNLHSIDHFKIWRVKVPDAQYLLKLCKYLIDALNKECRFSIQSPQFV